jgi:hypothetical protein
MFLATWIEFKLSLQRIETDEGIRVFPLTASLFARGALHYIFLKRFSKAWRASVGRDGDGGGLVAVEGWE